MKRFISLVLVCAALTLAFAGCGQSSAEESSSTNQTSAEVSTQSTQLSEKSSQLKYVFLFIGDGMSYPQIQATADYLGAIKDDDYMKAEPSLEDNEGAVLDGPSALNFMNFEVAGSAVTYDSNSF